MAYKVLLKTVSHLWLFLHVSSASSLRSQGIEGRLDGQVLLNLKDSSLTRCMATCRSFEGCKGFNRQKTTNTCELLSNRLCDGDLMTLTQGQSGWRYYDLHNATYPDPDHVFYNHSMCTERRLCSSECERLLGESCTDDIQCQVLSENSHCNAASTDVPGVCVCDTHYWKYNGTLCIHQTSLDSNTWDWTFKKIVNNMCSVTFTTRVVKDVWMYLGSFEDWHSGITQYYIILGGWTNTQSILDRDGSRKVTASTPGVLSNDYQNFTLHWCNGMIRLRQQGGTNFIAWNDPHPFTVNTIGFRLPYAADHAYMFFPHNLVDSYFPTSAETGVIRTNGHHWLEYKILPDAGLVSSINFTFECKAPKDCKVLFAKKNDHSRQYQVYLGAYSNKRNLLYNGRTGSRVIDLNQPNAVSSSVFRRFWIHVEGSSIVVGKGSEGTEPLFTYTDTGESTRTFSHIAISTCCNDWGYWKIHSHPQFHEYPNGGYRV